MKAVHKMAKFCSHPPLVISDMQKRLICKLSLQTTQGYHRLKRRTAQAYPPQRWQNGCCYIQVPSKILALAMGLHFSPAAVLLAQTWEVLCQALQADTGHRIWQRKTAGPTCLPGQFLPLFLLSHLRTPFLNLKSHTTTWQCYILLVAPMWHLHDAMCSLPCAPCQVLQTSFMSCLQYSAPAICT